MSSGLIGLLIVLVILVIGYGYQQGWFSAAYSDIDQWYQQMEQSGKPSSGVPPTSGGPPTVKPSTGGLPPSGGSAPARAIQPRPAKIIDCGYPDMTRGWYDFSGQGVRNDYCRFVGNNTFSCQMAGSTKPYADQAQADANKPHDPFVTPYGGC
jgi:hypothetical protein